MSGISVVPLYTKKGEPPAILHYDKSGEYYSYFFENWKEAVHFVAWIEIQENDKNEKKETEIYFKEWRDKYFDENEEFIGDLNEYQNKDIYIYVFDFLIDGKSDLKNLSICDICKDDQDE